jgi:hypothetical protein
MVQWQWTDPAKRFAQDLLVPLDLRGPLETLGSLGPQAPLETQVRPFTVLTVVYIILTLDTYLALVMRPSIVP